MPNKLDHTLTETVIAAAAAPDAKIAAIVAQLGAATVADALFAELASRAELVSGPTNEVPIRYDLSFGDEQVLTTLHLSDGMLRVEHGAREEAAATVKQGLVDLLREVFGPAGRHGATRQVAIRESDTFPGLDPNDPVNRRRADAVVGLRQLLDAVSPRPRDLTELAVRFESDKWGGHWYTPHYARYFEPYQDLPVRVLEIGVGGYNIPGAGGASLRMWKHYFRRGQIFGLDLFDKSELAENRLQILQGDQGDPEYLDAMAREFGPFDLVIDDGSHFSDHVITSFHALFPHVRPGGMYVVEDLQTSYWPGWRGAADPRAEGTSMAMVKDLLDGINHQEQMRSGDHRPTPTELAVTGVHAHHNIVFVDKGSNSEQGAPAWIPRTGDPSRWYSDK